MEHKALLKIIKFAFPPFEKPAKSVDNPYHCLACEETHDAFDALEGLQHLTPDNFNICYLNMNSLSDEALLYMMPRLMTLVLIGEENEWVFFIPQVLENLSPDAHGDRFDMYTLPQGKAILHFLDVIEPKYTMEIYEIWNEENQMMITYKYEERCFEAIGIARKYWQTKFE